MQWSLIFLATLYEMGFYFMYIHLDKCIVQCHCMRHAIAPAAVAVYWGAERAEMA